MAKIFLGGKADCKMAKCLEFGHEIAMVSNPVTTTGTITRKVKKCFF